MERKNAAANRLELAQAAHIAATAEIADLEARRNAALIADEDAKAAKLLGELEALRTITRGHADKIVLLEAEAKRERAEAVIRGHQELIGRFAKTLESSDADLAEAADFISQAWKKLCSGIDKREGARAAFSVRSSHARASAESIEGCAMSAEAVMALVSYEFYRISARPLLGSLPGARTRPHLPGAKPPSLDIALQPDKITPFTTKLRAASKFAVETLKAEIGNAADVPAPAITTPPLTNGADQPKRTNAEAELENLLKRQIELSQDVSPEGEAAYEAVVADIARVSQQVASEKMGAAHG